MMESFQYEDFSDLEGGKTRGLLSRCFTCHRLGTSWMSASVLILNAVLAPGIMSLPEAFSRAGGIGVGMGIQLMLLVVIVGSLYTLVCCAQVNTLDSYSDVIRVICGEQAEVASAICVVFYCYTFCVCSLVLIGDQWEKFFSDMCGEEFVSHWYMTRYFLIPITCSILILPLCFTAKIEFLTNFSMLGNMAVAYCVLLVVVKYFTMGFRGGTLTYRPSGWRDILSVIPVWCGNYQCHVEVVPIISTLRHSNQRLLSLSVLVAIATCATFYTLIATFGYLSFGQQVTPDLLLQYDDEPEVVAATIVLAFKMCMTYPTIHFCGRRAVESLWIRARGLSECQVVDGEVRRRIIITVVTFSLVLVISLIVPNLIVIVPILGSASATLMFIFPGLCMIQLYRGATMCGERYVLIFGLSAILMTSLGAFIVGFSWADLVVQLMTRQDFLQTGEELLESLGNTTTTASSLNRTTPMLAHDWF